MNRLLIVVALLGLLPASPATGEPSRVEALYGRHCASCHGARGQGDGPAAGLLSPRPRDFTSGLYKFRSTATGTLPTREDVIRSIRTGLPGTSMPAFGDLLSTTEIEELAALVLALAPDGSRPARPIALGASPARSDPGLRRGAALYARVGCAGCHGIDGRSAGWRPAQEGPGESPRPTDLSAPWTFRAGGDAESVARRVLTGLDGTPMPGFAGRLSPEDAWEIAYHVGTLARRPAWEEEDPAAVRSAGVARDPLERGRYLVNAMLCPLCHTPISPDTGAYDTGLFLAGGMRVSAYPWGVWYSRNLTPDPETGLGAWTEAEIVSAVTRGVARDGRRLDPMAMPWPWFSRLGPGDAAAIARYLKSLEPVRNPVPRPEPVPAAEAVGGKLLALLDGESAVAFWGGNAGADAALRGEVPAPAARRRLARAIGWGIPGLAMLLLVLPRGRWRLPVRVGGVGLLAAWGLLAVWPPLGLMSPELTTRWLFLGSPTLPASLSARDRALAERGEYLVTVAPCGLCHTPASAFVGFRTARTLAGGMDARWRVYGRAVATNLTPHPDGGIARVGDEALLRAIGSGIGRDGRSMHWQAMPWDIGSRWSLEDRRAMIAYLRALPPVPGRTPPPRGPRPDDPPADSFYFGDAARR